MPLACIVRFLTFIRPRGTAAQRLPAINCALQAVREPLRSTTEMGDGQQRSTVDRFTGGEAAIEGDPAISAGRRPMERTWNDEMPLYRTLWEQRHGHRGGRWEEHEPGYRYAWEMRHDDRYRNRS